MSDQHKMDQYAKSQGFKDFATMQAFHNKETQRITSPEADQSTGNVMGQPVQQTINQGLSLHPAMLLRYVLDKWNKATGGGQ